MIDSFDKFSSSKSDYVLSNMKNMRNQLDYHSPLSKSINQGYNYQNIFETNNISSSQNKSNESYKITPYPSGNIIVKSKNRLRTPNINFDKENIPLNFENVNRVQRRQFNKKSTIQMIQKQQKPRQILIPQQSKEFIRESIQKSMRNLPNFTEQTLEQDLQRLMNYVLQNQVQSGQLKLQNKKENSELLEEHQLSSVLSYKYNNEQIEYFLTEEDNQNNISDQGIKLLSELKVELNCLINIEDQQCKQNSCKQSQNLQKKRKYKNQVSFDEQLVLNSGQNKSIIEDIDQVSIKFSLQQSNQAQLFIKKKSVHHFEQNKINSLQQFCIQNVQFNSKICQQVQTKLQQLKLNIDLLYKKITLSLDQDSQVSQQQQTTSYKIGIDNIIAQTINQIYTDLKNSKTKQQPQIQLIAFHNNKITQTQQKSLIYPDSQIVILYSKENNLYQKQFSHLFNRQNQQCIYQLESQNKIPQNEKQIYENSQINFFLSNKSGKIFSQQDIKQSPRQKSIHSQASIDILQSEYGNSFVRCSVMNFDLDKNDFKIQYNKLVSKLSELQVQRQNQKQEYQKKSNNKNGLQVSSNSNESFNLEELNKNFDSRFKRIFAIK